MTPTAHHRGIRRSASRRAGAHPAHGRGVRAVDRRGPGRLAHVPAGVGGLTACVSLSCARTTSMRQVACRCTSPSWPCSCADRGHDVEVLGPGGGGLGSAGRGSRIGAPWPDRTRGPPVCVVPAVPSNGSGQTSSMCTSRSPRARRCGRRSRRPCRSWPRSTPGSTGRGSTSTPDPVLAPVRHRLAATIAVSEAAAAFVERAVPDLEPLVIPNGLSVPGSPKRPPVRGLPAGASSGLIGSTPEGVPGSGRGVPIARRGARRRLAHRRR